jgi:hypothetical protein
MNDFIAILNIPEARRLVEHIEELEGETEAELVRIRESYIKELADKYGYCYK